MFLLGFLTRWDNATFRDIGTEVPSLCRSVPGQRHNRTSSKSCNRTGQAVTAYQNIGWDARCDNYYFSVKIRDEMQDRTITTFPMISYFRTSFPFLERPFPVLEHPFLFYIGSKGQRDKEVFLSQDKGTRGHPDPWKH